MTIELFDNSITRVSKAGSGNFTVAAGKTLKIKTTPHGDNILDVTVPEDEIWHVTATLNIVVESV